MKYKVGDRVRIKSLDWYNENKDKDGLILCGNNIFDNYMSVFCGSVVTISRVYPYNQYDIQEDIHDRAWTDEMIEGLVEEGCNCITVDDIPDTIQYQTSSACIHNGFYGYSDSEGNEISEWNLPEGYIFKDENGNVINATKIVLEKKKKEYPKTYEECCKVLDIQSDWHLALELNNSTSCDLCVNNEFEYVYRLEAFRKLLICRDAYWKIVGDEMGLGKPWEPDYTEKTVKYCLRTNYGRIVQTRTSHDNHPFSFPTEEMRNAFKENFDPDIEICKELL